MVDAGGRSNKYDKKCSGNKKGAPSCVLPRPIYRASAGLKTALKLLVQ